MTALVDTLAKLADAGGMIRVADGNVTVDAPAGMLTAQDREILARHKADILTMLGRVSVSETTPSTGETEVSDTETPEIVFVRDLDHWTDEHAVLPVVCDLCGGLERWRDDAGSWHCAKCDPPSRARDHAARLRTRQHKPTWPIEGADEVLKLTPDDLPPVPWRSGSLKCVDSGRLLNEIKIDLETIGRNGVNHRSGRLRQDVAAILRVTLRKRREAQECKS